MQKYKALKYLIKTATPLIFPSYQTDSNMVSTLKFIPGSSILGYYANKYLKISPVLDKNAHEDDLFKKYFLSNQLIFSNAYPAKYNDFDKLERFYPCPLSVQNDKEKEKYIYDLLNHEELEIQTKSVLGFISENLKYNLNVLSNINFHHERDKKSGSTIDGHIFNYESIDVNQLFHGRIIGLESDLIILKNQMFKNERITLGRSKNAQYGIAQIEFEKDIEEYISEINVNNDSENSILTFLSDTIIKNEFGFSSTNIQDLEKLLEVKILKSYIKNVKVESYVNIWKLKKPEDIAYKSGSCFIIDKLPEKYKEIQVKGIGERCSEGYGRVIFNWQNEDQLNFSNLKKAKIKVDESKIPDICKKIIISIIKDNLINEVKNEALKMGLNYSKNNPISVSLASKLKSFIDSSENFNKFKDMLNNIRKPAQDQLNNCNFNKESLFDYINSFKSDNFLRKFQNQEVLELNVSDSDFQNLLIKIYFSTIFLTIRKNLKSG